MSQPGQYQNQTYHPNGNNNNNNHGSTSNYSYGRNSSHSNPDAAGNNSYKNSNYGNNNYNNNSYQANGNNHQAPPQGKGMKRGRSWEQLQNRHTRVLFVRNVAEVTPDIHLANLCGAYGPVTQILQMVEKRSAFVEFEVFEDAERCIKDFRAQPPNLDGRILQFAYSGRDKIKMPDIPFPKNNPPSKVLNLKISNIKYQITIDVCKKLMGPNLEKVSIREPLSGEGCVNVLCQFSDLAEADKKKATLDGKYIYTGCNRIAATYSHLANLEVPSDNAFMHDFTRPAQMAAMAPIVHIESGLLGDEGQPAVPQTITPNTNLGQNNNTAAANNNNNSHHGTPNSNNYHSDSRRSSHVSHSHAACSPPGAPPALPPMRQVTEIGPDGHPVTRTVIDQNHSPPSMNCNSNNNYPSTSPTTTHYPPVPNSTSSTPGGSSTPKPWDTPPDRTLSRMNSGLSQASVHSVHSHSMHAMSPQSTPGQRVDNVTPKGDFQSLAPSALGKAHPHHLASAATTASSPVVNKSEGNHTNINYQAQLKIDSEPVVIEDEVTVIEDSGTSTEQTIKDVAQIVKETASDFVHSIAEKTDEIKEKTAPVIENIVDKVVEVANDVKEACHEKVVEEKLAKEIIVQEEESGENKEPVEAADTKEAKPIVESNGEHAENVAVSTN